MRNLKYGTRSIVNFEGNKNNKTPADNFICKPSIPLTFLGIVLFTNNSLTTKMEH